MPKVAQDHWQGIYQSKQENEVSWYQNRPDLSLSFIERYCPDKTASIIDVGGGASRLIDYLIGMGYQQLSVLDISQNALNHSQQRLQSILPQHQAEINWTVADITRATFSTSFDLWHDRAVFHFLTEPESRQSYIANLKASLQVGGYLVIATFAIGGPEKCSGLDIVQYDADKLQEALGDDFELVSQQTENHHTPFNSEQAFNYFVFRYFTH